MIQLALILLPPVAALALVAGPVRRRAEVLLFLVALAESLLAFAATVSPNVWSTGDVIQADGISQLFPAFANPIVLGIAASIWSRVMASPSLRPNLPLFVLLALVFLSAINAVFVGNHLIFIWIALEATSLAAAPMIVRPGHPASRRASWHYLLFSTVGLGLVLLGFLCLGRSAELQGHDPFFLNATPHLIGHADAWMKLGLALVLLGIGTKLGLAPMYSWLPETYDEAPAAVTALLAAVQFNAALVLLLRVLQNFRSGNEELIAHVLVFMGMASMAVTTFSIIATRNLKRLIAYASINHAGVIAIGLGVGKGASFGVLLYVISNAFIKAILFLTAGQIKARYRTKCTDDITNLIKHLPYSALFLMIGTFALLGFPPFGSFFGELLILSSLVSSQWMSVFLAFCVLITITFIATGRTIFPMIWGEPKKARDWPRQTLLASSPKLFFFAALVILGIYIPPVVNDLIQQVAMTLEGP